MLRRHVSTILSHLQALQNMDLFLEGPEGDSKESKHVALKQYFM